jgi:hypothetical protein
MDVTLGHGIPFSTDRGSTLDNCSMIYIFSSHIFIYDMETLI